jgi:hypothetical protein
MNMSLINGVVEGMEAKDLVPCLDPRRGECCVTVRPARPEKG